MSPMEGGGVRDGILLAQLPGPLAIDLLESANGSL
jgi:hypothetical protein